METSKKAKAEKDPEGKKLKESRVILLITNEFIPLLPSNLGLRMKFLLNQDVRAEKHIPIKFSLNRLICIFKLYNECTRAKTTIKRQANPVRR